MDVRKECQHCCGVGIGPALRIAKGVSGFGGGGGGREESLIGVGAFGRSSSVSNFFGGGVVSFGISGAEGGIGAFFDSGAGDSFFLTSASGI
uniref:Peptidase A1 domain-containing protein n=1 Tax=Caenorhabditis tropicalis TaxID=1561998 RepID=A0A1I7UIT6_9PELO